MSKKKMGKFSKQGKALLEELRDYAFKLVQELKDIDEDLARQFSNELMYLVSQNWGGQSVYIIKDDTFIADQRDIEIYNDFNGHNHSELAKKYNLTVVYIYRIVKRMHELEKKRLQPDLF